MSQLQRPRADRSIRLAIFAIATALVLVPTIARARQRVEVRDATRLSIRNSWVGVTPPTKASVAPITIAVVPTPAALPPEPARTARAVPAVAPTVVRVELSRLEPLRGPPSSAF
jgi:hypothetical protein